MSETPSKLSISSGFSTNIEAKKGSERYSQVHTVLTEAFNALNQISPEDRQKLEHEAGEFTKKDSKFREPTRVIFQISGPAQNTQIRYGVEAFKVDFFTGEDRSLGHFDGIREFHLVVKRLENGDISVGGGRGHLISDIQLVITSDGRLEGKYNSIDSQTNANSEDDLPLFLFKIAGDWAPRLCHGYLEQLKIDKSQNIFMSIAGIKQKRPSIIDDMLQDLEDIVPEQKR